MARIEILKFISFLENISNYECMVEQMLTEDIKELLDILYRELTKIT